MHTTAIVIAGAGARGAYEAGVLSVVVPRLLDEPGDGAERRVVVLGTSAGAINTAILSAIRDPVEATATALDLWKSIDVGDVIAGLQTTAVRDAASYLVQLVGGGRRLHSLLDSSPLRRTMEEGLDWGDLQKNLDTGGGWVERAAIVTTACATGRTTVFVQGGERRLPRSDEVRGIDYAAAELAVPHVLASAAIPVAFRPVRVDEPAPVAGWYVDGGVRLNAPIRPALDLKADRIVVVATTPDPDTPRTEPVSPAEPDVFDASGVLMSAVQVDRMAEDVRSLRRTNALIKASQAGGGPETLVRADGSPFRVVPHLYLGPPAGGIISAEANRVFKERYGGWRGPLSDLGILGRLLGGSRETRGELLSFLFFDRVFHAALIELGQEHARRALGPSGTALPWAS
ncbi:MAG: patatin-like phospholipase family protein [Actinobacteria bacterium]|nr:patatin-like phospholipase family protein [Actinomycetota bacterium]